MLYIELNFGLHCFKSLTSRLFLNSMHKICAVSSQVNCVSCLISSHGCSLYAKLYSKPSEKYIMYSDFQTKKAEHFYFDPPSVQSHLYSTEYFVKISIFPVKFFLQLNYIELMILLTEIFLYQLFLVDSSSKGRCQKQQFIRLEN